MIRNLCILPAAASVAFGLAAPPAVAQAYPTKPVRIIVPFAGADLVARLLAAKLGPTLNEQVITDPRFGAGGNIAHAAAAKAAPDGYTLLMGALPIVINPNLNPNVGYDPVRDFTGIAPL